MDKHLDLLTKLMMKTWIYDWDIIEISDRPKLIKWYILDDLKD